MEGPFAVWMELRIFRIFSAFLLVLGPAGAVQPQNDLLSLAG